MTAVIWVIVGTIAIVIGLMILAAMLVYYVVGFAIVLTVQAIRHLSHLRRKSQR